MAGSKEGASKILARDPDFFKKIGSKGGQAKVPKGKHKKFNLERIA